MAPMHSVAAETCRWAAYKNQKRSRAMNETGIPTPEILDTLDWEGLKYVTVKAALELDVFNIIAEGHHTVEEIANGAKASVRGMEILLNALCPLGFLTKSNRRYELTPMSDTYLAKGNPSYLASVYLVWWQSRERLVECVRKGCAVWNISEEENQDLWAMYASQELVTWPQAIEKSKQTWGSIGIGSSVTPGLNILDVAGGTGSKSFVLAQVDPSVRVTVIDFPKVLQVSAQIAEKMGVSRQVSYLPGDITEIEFPIEKFGLVNFGAILYYFNADQVKGIFEKAYRALQENGILTIHTLIADEERCQSLAPLLIAIEFLHDAKYSHIYTFSEYKQYLESVNFTEVTQIGENLIRAMKM
jgi:ubiquinone/menaquinone biosynthesis C-methylase UbiE